MTYVQYLNKIIREKIATTSPLIVFGQNISAGSCLSGLSKGLESGPARLIINTPNCENSLVGIGFGSMMNGVSSIYLMKQLDFLLLGVDQIVNTYNIARVRNLTASFTIVCIIVDSGYEGPQATLNNLSDFCSFSHIDGYTITNQQDADIILERHLVAPGFRIIGVSQRLFKNEVLRPQKLETVYASGKIVQYSKGKDVVVVNFNFAYPQGKGICEEFENNGFSASHYAINSAMITDWRPILTEVKKIGKVVVLDDSKSANRPSQNLLMNIYRDVPGSQVVYRGRQFSKKWLAPNPDQFEFDPIEILCELNLLPEIV